MEWTPDVSAGDWLRERIDDPWRGTMHDVVPRGFDAYARVFHPASVREIPGGRMPTFAESDAATVEDSLRLMSTVVDRPLTWREAAEIFGATFHAQAQWHALAGDDDGSTIFTPDGRWVDPPATGGLESDLFGALARVLAAHTSTPDAGFAALWEGRGGLVGHLGLGPSRTFFQAGDPNDAVLQHHNAMLGNSMKDVWNNVFRRRTWQEGILPRELSEGPRLQLPERAFVLFAGGVDEFARNGWWLEVPWRDRPAEAHGFEPAAQTPNLVWPDDRAWVMVSEVDFDSTIVGGSAELVAALVADPNLEAAEIPADTVLSA
jgi:hypothetical protein